ncbi:MAG: 3-oxoadipate enol-lactonase [Acidimicrobiales bacterium]
MTESGSLERSGASIAWRTDGVRGAPVVLMSNSLGTTTRMWDDQMSALVGHCFVVRYDHRGHGGSTASKGPYDIELLASDALAVLDHLGVATASLVGLSIGGSVAIWIAANAPQRVERLTVCCSAPSFPPAEQWARRAASVREAGVQGLLDSLLERWFTARFAGRGAARTRLAEMLATIDAEGYAGCCEALATMDLSPLLAKITAPTLVLGGGEDPVVPIGRSGDLASAIGGASLAVLGGAAHLANIEKAESFNEALVGHLLAIPRSRGERVRREVLGESHVARSAERSSATDAAFLDLVKRVPWGEIWTRPGLDRRTRSSVTIAMLIALGRFDELAMHLEGARRNGLEREEIVEILLHSAIYCGFPAANQAFAVARAVLDRDAEG